MKFLADENIEWPIIVQMRKWGYDIKSVQEISPGIDDNKVLKLAFSESRILLTNDTDFGSIVFHQSILSHGIVLLRFLEESSKKKLEVIKHLLSHHKDKLTGHFTVVSENQIRIRPIGRL